MRSSPRCATCTPSSGRPGPATSPTSAAELEPEERAVLAQAAHWYVHVFGDRPAIWDDAEVDEPTVRRRLRVGGWVDLTLRTDDGGHELRQFSLWGGRVPDEDPLELAALRVAFLRLTPWLDGAPLRLAWVDLVRGLVRERIVEPRRATRDHRVVRVARGARARTDRGPGRGAGIRLRRMRLRRRVPRAPPGRAPRPPARPPPGHPARHADQPRHLAPVPARMAQPPPVRHPGERQPSWSRARPADARRAAVRARARVVPRRRPRGRRARRPRVRRQRPHAWRAGATHRAVSVSGGGTRRTR